MRPVYVTLKGKVITVRICSLLPVFGKFCKTPIPIAVQQHLMFVTKSTDVMILSQTGAQTASLSLRWTEDCLSE